MKLTLVGVNARATWVDRGLRLSTMPSRHAMVEESVADASVESANERIRRVESSISTYCSKKAGYSPPLPRQMPVIHCS